MVSYRSKTGRLILLSMMFSVDWSALANDKICTLLKQGMCKTSGEQCPSFVVGLDVLDKPTIGSKDFDKNHYSQLKPNGKNTFNHQPSPYRYLEDILATGSGVEFTVAGVNPTATLRKIPTLTGATLETITERCQGTPGGGTSTFFSENWSEGPFKGLRNSMMRRSAAGFLKREQTLRDLLVQDNIRVLEELGLTHQTVAKPLLEAISALEKSMHDSSTGGTESKRKIRFRYGEDTYIVESSYMAGEYGFGDQKKIKWASGWVGFGTQGSPFNDNLFADYMLKFTNERTGQVFKIDALTPHLIYRYGFYQGGEYRTNPDTIVNFFQLEP